MSGKKKVDMSGGGPLEQNPFGALDRAGLPEAPPPNEREAGKSARQPPRPGTRGRVEIRRERSGRGGKTVTTATAFRGVCPAEQQEWIAFLRRKCGAGGASRPGAIEIQGDRREEFVRFFEERGFRPVLAGG